ncbi:MAG: hypothetical protein LBQ39_03445 [Tannerellaceae bacterium]|jgi:hypothetical protein|nr:hypothetical protein [Tannerellaceae bacterium]
MIIDESIQKFQEQIDELHRDAEKSGSQWLETAYKKMGDHYREHPIDLQNSVEIAKKRNENFRKSIQVEDEVFNKAFTI